MTMSHFLTASKKPQNIVKGVYCDFFGTLVSPKGQINTELVAYLNAKHTAGEMVVVFSTSCEDTVEKLPKLGLHPDIAKVQDKYKYSETGNGDRR